MSSKMKIASKNYYSCLKILFQVSGGSHRSQAPNRSPYKFNLPRKLCIPRSCSDLPLETLFSLVFTNLHCIHCKLHPPIVTTTFFCFFWVSWYFCLNYLTRGKPRTTLFLSSNTPKAKFSLITALGHSPDNPWLLQVFTHEPKLSQKMVSRVKTLCPCMSTLLVIVHTWPALAYHLCNTISVTTIPCQPFVTHVTTCHKNCFICSAQNIINSRLLLVLKKSQ